MRLPTVLFLIVGMMASAACGGDARTACERARDKLHACKTEIPLRPSWRGSLLVLLDVTDDCTAQTRCVAECVRPAPCDAIAYAAADASTDPNTTVPAGAEEFQRCLYSCLDVH